MGRRKTQKKIEWCLVKFTEDNIIISCLKSKTKMKEGILFARWPSDGRMYPGILLASGDKDTMAKQLELSDACETTVTNTQVVLNSEQQAVSKKTFSMCEDFEVINADHISSRSYADCLPDTGETALQSFSEPIEPQDEQEDIASDHHEDQQIDPSYTVLQEDTSSHEECSNFNTVNGSFAYQYSTKSKDIENEHSEITNMHGLIYTNLTPLDVSEFQGDEELQSNDFLLNSNESYNHFQEEVISQDHSETTYYSTDNVQQQECSNGTVIINTQLETTEKMLENKLQNVDTTEPNVCIAKKSTVNKSQRLWDKKYPCCFCLQMYAKLPRHFQSVHSGETEVTEFLALPKSFTERKEKLDLLRNRGLFQHNCSVLKKGNGIIIPKKRPNDFTSPKHFLPCGSCSGFYSRQQLVKHYRHCVQKRGGQVLSGRNRGIRTQSTLILPSNPQTSKAFQQNILLKMNDDKVQQTVLKDTLILEFGKHMYEKLCHEKRHYRLIPDRMRELGRFLIAAKEEDQSISELKDILKPTKYSIVRNAVRKVSGYDEEKNIFKTPSLALKLGMSLKKCAMVLKGILMEKNKKINIQEIESFIEIFELKWTVEVTRKAHRTLHEKKWNQPRRIPLAKDITSLNKYLLNEDKNLTLALVNSPTPKIFEQLAEVTLCRTLVLNRRRAGEIQYMKLSDFQNSPESDKESEAFQSLTESEKVLVKTLKRVEIRGEKGRKVPVIFTKDLQNSVNLLIRKRQECLVDTCNEYLFPSRNQCGYFRSDAVLKKFALSCGAHHPEYLTSTQLRKHVATFSQILNLREHELEALAKYMGHDISVHKQYYRLAEETMDLAKIAKLLIKMEKGCVGSLRNKNLDEIEVEGEISDLDGDSDNDLQGTDESAPFSHHGISEGVPKKKLKMSVSPLKATNSKTYCKVRKIVKRKPWSFEELSEVRKYFQGWVQLRKVPSKVEVEEFLGKNSDKVRNRTWKDIKYCVYNSFKKK